MEKAGRTMEKYLVTIEFRCNDLPCDPIKKGTGGVYDAFEDACIEGNKLMEDLEDKFPLHVFPGGRTAKRERFSKNGGCFGGKKNLITNLAYLKTPFDFYARITTLKYGDIDNIIDDVVNSSKRYDSKKYEEYRISVAD